MVQSSTPPEALLALCREALERGVRGRPNPGPWPAHPDLDAPGGAFVTLRTSGGRLRGCIGRFPVANAEPLGRVVQRMSVAAALHDPRFAPLDAAEAVSVRIEVSVLSPLEAMADANDFAVGTHGVSVELGNSRGVLLPQVAIERGLDRAAFAAAVLDKAGLPPTAAADPAARWQRFTVTHYEEAP